MTVKVTITVGNQHAELSFTGDGPSQQWEEQVTQDIKALTDEEAGLEGDVATLVAEERTEHDATNSLIALVQQLVAGQGTSTLSAEDTAALQTAVAGIHTVRASAATATADLQAEEADEAAAMPAPPAPAPTESAPAEPVASAPSDGTGTGSASTDEAAETPDEEAAETVDDGDEAPTLELTPPTA